MNDICVVIPMFNFNEMTQKAVELTLQNAGIGCDVLVVDDASATPFKCDSERVRIIRNENNMGFTNSINKGILDCQDKYKYIMLLNNDTEPQTNFLKHLIQVMEEDRDIAVASSVRYVNANGEEIYEYEGSDWMRGFVKSSNKIQGDIRMVEWVPFCSVLLSLEAIRSVGLLDKRMRDHCSDNDWCARANYLGYRVAVVSKSIVRHYRSVTIKSSPENLTFSQDQKLFLESIMGFNLAKLLSRLPMDSERKHWGILGFQIVKENEVCPTS